VTALRAAAVALLLLLGLGGAGAGAQDFDAAAVARVGGLEALQPLDPVDLGNQRAGRLPQSLVMPRTAGGPVRFWDEVARPIRPPTSASQGTITSTSRGMR
jgi:hypothetical protein